MREVDTDKTLSYVLNATKALLNDEITLSIYFRICHVVINTLEEDLQFLKTHVKDDVVEYSVEVGGLMTSGLAYHTGVGDDNKPRYKFTKPFTGELWYRGHEITKLVESLGDELGFEKIARATRL